MALQMVPVPLSRTQCWYAHCSEISSTALRWQLTFDSLHQMWAPFLLCSQRSWRVDDTKCWRLKRPDRMKWTCDKQSGSDNLRRELKADTGPTIGHDSRDDHLPWSARTSSNAAISKENKAQFFLFISSCLVSLRLVNVSQLVQSTSYPA